MLFIMCEVFIFTLSLLFKLPKTETGIQFHSSPGLDLNTRDSHLDLNLCRGLKPITLYLYLNIFLANQYPVTWVIV